MGIFGGGNIKAVHEQVNADVGFLPNEIQISVGYCESRKREAFPKNPASREAHADNYTTESQKG